jgi:hypothetical protein
MGTLDDVEKDTKQQLLHTTEPGRAAAISRQLHTKLLPIFLLMASLCYLDRSVGFCAQSVCGNVVPAS